MPHGFEITHFAQDYLVDLTGNVYEGRKYRDLRQRHNSIRKKGIEFKEIKPAEMKRSAWCSIVAELQALERENLELKIQKQPTRVFQGSLTVSNLFDRRLFVAFSKTGAAEAFIVLTPYRGRHEFGLETYRFRVGSTPYVLRALIFDVIQTLKQEGVQKLSLGIVPGIGCRRIPGDSQLTHRLMNFWVTQLNFISNISGVHHFKTRFRPEEESRYVCVFPHASLGSAWAFLKIWGGINVDLRRLCAAWWQHLCPTRRLR